MCKTLFLVMAVFVGYNTLAAPTPVVEPKAADKPKIEAKPTVADYKKVYLKYAKWHNNLTNEDFYDTMYNFKDKKTAAVKKFKDLPSFDKQMFYVIQADLLSKTLLQLQEKWTTEMNSLPSGTESDEDEREAIKEDVEMYANQIGLLRKKVAAKHEELAEKLFKDYPKEFTEEERNMYLKNLRERNDREKLIERNK